MFDLEKQIESWRRGLPDRLRDNRDVADELESHLRAQMEELLAAGAAPPDAWQQALQRLGPAGELSAEFARAHRAGGWAPERIAWLFLFGSAALLAMYLLLWLSRGSTGALLAAHIFAVTIGYVGGLVVGGVAAWAILARAFAGWDEPHDQMFRLAMRRLAITSATLTAIGIALGAIWSRAHLGAYWGWDQREIGGVAVFCWGTMLVCCLHAGVMRGAAAAMIVGLIGSVVVTLAWLGPVLSLSRTYGARNGTLSLIIAAFLIANAALAAVALFPSAWLRPRRPGAGSR